MLRPVSIIALDEPSAQLAAAAEKAVARQVGIEGLVQTCALIVSGAVAQYIVGGSIPSGGTPAASLPPQSDLEAALLSMQARWQAPDSALHVDDRISKGELVLITLAAAGPANGFAIDVARQVRTIYSTLLTNHYANCELVCLLPDLFESPAAEHYAAAYSLFKALSHDVGSWAGDTSRLFDTVWLLASGNSNRVNFGKLIQNNDVYVQAFTGLLTLEPERSGSPPGTFRPRGMDATFSSFGYGDLFLPRDIAASRLEARFAADMVANELLASDRGASPALSQTAAKRFVGSEDFTSRAARLAVEAGQSISREFQPKFERAVKASDVIVSLRRDRVAFSEAGLVEKQRVLAELGETTASELIDLLSKNIDDIADQKDFIAATRFLEAFIDPFPDVNWHSAAQPPRNLITEIVAATKALDEKLHLEAKTAETSAKKKRIRDLRALLADQRLSTETIAAAHRRTEDAGVDEKTQSTDTEEAQKNRATAIASSEKELAEVIASLSGAQFAEDQQNSLARTAAKDAVRARLASATTEQEQKLEALAVEQPKAAAALSDAMESRRAFLHKHAVVRPFGATALVIGLIALGWVADLSFVHIFVQWVAHNPLRAFTGVAIIAALYACVVWLRYTADVEPSVKAARDWARRLEIDIPATRDRLKSAHADELQFEYDVSLRETKIGVLKRVMRDANRALEHLVTRVRELNDLRDSFVREQTAATIQQSSLMIPVIRDDEVDSYYVSTAPDRVVVERDFLRLGVKRSAARHLTIGAARQRIAVYASQQFTTVREATLANVMAGRPRIASDAAISQRLKMIGDLSAPLIELRDIDMYAQEAMQRDTTIWLDHPSDALADELGKRFKGEVKSGSDPLHAYLLSRALHFPAYVMSQIEYYRAQYMAHPIAASEDLPDLLPTELILSGAVRSFYERLLIAQALGVIELRDGNLVISSDGAALGDSYLNAAQRLAAQGSESLRRALENAITPRLRVGDAMIDSLRELHGRGNLTPMDKQVIDGLVRNLSSTF